MADLIPLRSSDPAPPVEVIGGKALGLVRLIAAGLPAPDGLVVPVDHPDLDTAAGEAHARLRADTYAVRSSAPAEDGDEASLAGANPSRLRVLPPALAAAIAEVRDADGRGPIPVLVMAHIEPDAGGVAFSTDPVSGGADCLIASTSGHHAAITDGVDAGTEQRVTPRGRVRGTGPLTARQARSVARLTRRAADLLGTAADVEFVVVDGEVQMLQARPLTSFPVWEAPPGVWGHGQEYSTAPGAPIFQELMATLQTEGFREGFAEAGAMIDTIEQRVIGGYWYGRPVIVGVPADRGGTSGPPPAPLIGLLSRLHPAQRARTARARAFLLGDGPRRARERFAAMDWEGAAATAAAAARPEALERDLEKSLTTILGTFDLLFPAHFRWIPTAYGQTVGAAGRALEAGGLSRADALRIVAGTGGGGWTGHTGAHVRAAAAAIAGDEPARAMLEDATADPQRVLEDLMARDDATGSAVRQLLSEIGSICMGYDVSVPTIGEQPAVVVQALRQQIAAEAGHPASDGAGRAEALLDAVPPALHDRIREAWAEHEQRDRQSLAIQTVVGALRLVLVEAGRRMHADGLLDDADDVFCLSIDELRIWTRTAVLDPAAALTAASRRRTLERMATLRPPPIIGGAPSAMPDLRHLPRAARAVNQRMAWSQAGIFGEAPTNPSDGPHHTGRIAAPGIVEGTARIVRGPHEGTVLRPGEIIVCPFTMAVWTSLLQQCAGVVTESGGPLSHAAIVARELGVPAVCGVVGATTSIRDGARIRVDGDRGTVTVLDA